MAYRDEHEKCPRCAADLSDAVIGLACATCRGLWISPASVWEMAANMQTPPGLIDLPFIADKNRDKLACPTCREGMELVTLYGVPIDLCQKHGIWFDANELASVLMRAVRKP